MPEASPRRRLLALLIPAGQARPCALAMLADAAGDISDAIGGGLFDELLVGLASMPHATPMCPPAS